MAEVAGYYLFDELRFVGRDKRRGAGFGGAFSVYKNRLGIPAAQVVFHSFRHNVSTQLRNMPESGEHGIRESWIDDFLGHEYGRGSVGVKKYLDGIDLENVAKVAQAVNYADFWDVRTLMG
ncbi:hypothetical protein ACMAUO_12075 [Gluconacetobacter sp. Hr-1-5]|uniref:hypothetical protein n=1 Tax=Gluconacetobacter sp. Hr-1-5 TaxID=3395370 RepID=UPI003B526055